MKLGLQLKLKQHLAPQLIQSLKMVQAPVLKLEQMLRLELAINPLLEEIEVTEDPAEDSELSENNDDSSDDTVEWDEYLFDDEEGYKVREPRENTESKFEGTAVAGESLYDHLLEQLSFLKLTDEEHLIGEYIIGNIDNAGYLTISVGEMASELEDLYRHHAAC